MRILIVVTLMGLLGAGCEKSVLAGKLEGRFKGTFQRLTDGVVDPVVSQVNLHFSERDFSGSSTRPRYPALCEGTYSTTRSTIKVSNTCFFTAEFDWSLIFTGDYKYDLSGDSLTIWKEYPHGKDMYRLKRVE